MKKAPIILSTIVVLSVGAIPDFVKGSSFRPGTAPSSPTINCSNPVMTSAPKFLASPAGAAKYPFTLSCNSPGVSGVISVTMEGSWTPTETRRDRPNDSESVTIRGYEPFLKDRVPGGTIFMYWTGSCTADPWLQGGTCSRFGEYIPDDLRLLFVNIVSRPFPLTGNAISSSLKQQLVAQYQAMNAPNSARSNSRQSQGKMLQPSQIITQAQRDRALAVQPPTVIMKPKSPISDLSRAGILSRGANSEQGKMGDVETAEQAMTEDGYQDEARHASLALDRPVHVITLNGDTAQVEPGMYEVTVVMDVLLALAKEGTPTVLLPSSQSTHNETIKSSLAAAVPAGSDEIQFVLLTPDGKRFDAQGTRTGIKARTADASHPLSDKAVQDALQTAATKPRSVSPACRPNPADIGPKWIPVPCTMPTAASGGTP